MNVHEVIQGRTSVRRYATDPVPEGVVERVLQLATKAPSWANKQCWRFVVVSDPQEKRSIGKSTAMAHMARACDDAPYVIVLCADPRDSQAKDGMQYYLFDCALAMANLVLAACSEGLGTCIITAFHEPEIRELLKISEGIRVVALTPLGFPDERAIPSSRKPLEEVVSRDHWGSPFVRHPSP